MVLFLSKYENKIDSKGRISVPASFRLELEKNNFSLFIFKSLILPCLEGCGQNRINQIVSAIDQMDSLSKDTEILQMMLSSAQEMKIDSEGRINLSEEFITNAGIKDTALFAGIGQSFRIWEPNNFYEREKDSLLYLKNNGIPKLKLGNLTDQK